MGYKIAINKMALREKLPKGDPRWEEFNTSFVNQELPLMEVANAIFLGHSYTAWHNGRRCTENFTCAQFIAVDLETHDERSSIDYLRNMEFVQVYGGLIYTTPSHTDEDPRSRVMFFLDQPIDNADAYKAVIDFTYSMFPGSDSNCIKASGFFYGSYGCQIEIIDRVLPVAHLRNYYKRWQRLNPKPEPKQQPQTQPKVQAPSNINKDIFAELQDALHKINPWSISYQDWVKVLMAIHHDLGDAGLSIAEQWAQGKEGEVKGKFRSFKANGNGKVVTLKTVFGMAKTH
jgi:hypothetical protein